MIFENDQNQSGYERRSRITNPTQFLGLGKLPPQAIDLEEAVLGALMLEKDSAMLVMDILKPDVFYVDKHQKLFMSILMLFERGNPVDILTVTAELRSRGELEMIGGAYYITELTNRVSSAANIEYHARLVLQKFIQRELIRVSTDIIQEAYNDTADVLDLLEVAEKNILDIYSNRSSRQVQRIGELAISRKAEYRKPVINGLTGLSAGLTELDAMSHGWQNTDLIIVAARPSMGKTAFALQCARHPVFDLDKPVVIFSLEMSSLQLTDRIISAETGLKLENILTHDLLPEQLNEIDAWVDKIEQSDLLIDDTPSLSIFEFRAKCRRLKAKHDIQLIIIDYLQLMNGKEGRSNREQEIGNISRTLKAVAKELNVPVIALSQLSRDVEKRPGGSKRPMLSDLRESGSIEQDADVVLFLYRDEYYGIYQDANGESTVGCCEAIIAKNRNGKIGKVKMEFNGAKMRFRNWKWQEKEKQSTYEELQQGQLNLQSPGESSEPDADDLPF